MLGIEPQDCPSAVLELLEPQSRRGAFRQRRCLLRELTSLRFLERGAEVDDAGGITSTHGNLDRVPYLSGHGA